MFAKDACSPIGEENDAAELPAHQDAAMLDISTHAEEATTRDILTAHAEDSTTLDILPAHAEDSGRASHPLGAGKDAASDSGLQVRFDAAGVPRSTLLASK